MTNTFSFKRVALSFLVDVRKGGVFLSQTTSQLRSSGLAAETANRDRFVQDGVIRNADGTTRPNDVQVSSVQAYWGNLDNSISPENNIFDASFAKLREISVTYTLPPSLLRGYQAASVTLAGRDLHTWTNYAGIDPEVNVNNIATSSGTADQAVTPPLSRFIASFNLKF